jgi:uncharacterized protein YndB with AHSA1/START domain
MSDLAHGCLVLSDISGYTEYLGGVELQHSHDILADLLGVVAGQLSGPLELAKLEGDAVFCFDRGELDGETLVTAIASCYLEFARRQRTISVATSCECNACRRIPELDLKFLAHRGSFVEHDVAGRHELVGSDVVLAHRLLKNSITERTGVNGYAFLTDACTRELSIDAADVGLTRHVEHYDDIGDASGWLLDLEERWRREEERETARVTEESAALVLETELPTSPARAWLAMTDPKAQKAWRIGADRIDVDSPGGARGVGSVTHCVHGKTTITQEILDWKPHGYFTYRERNPIGECLWTAEFSPLGRSERTALSWRMELCGGAGQRIMWTLMRRRIRRMLEGYLDALIAFVEREPESGRRVGLGGP